ncbi:MAG: SIR2 family protein [Bacilli bacterium]
MEKVLREQYIFQKKCLLILLYLFYINDVDYDSIIFRNFGFHFDPTCNFKVIVKSKKEHIHKYTVHIFNELINDDKLKEMDVMGNVNIIHVTDCLDINFYDPKQSLNIYFDEANFLARGFVEGKPTHYDLLKDSKSVFKEELLFNLSNDKSNENINCSATSFILYLLRLYSTQLPIDMVLGAGTNIDYGAKDWEHLVEALNLDFYKDDDVLVSQIKHYVGHELFVSSKLIKTNGFDIYDSLNSELYLFEEAKSFNDSDSTLYRICDFMERKNERIDVITYNYDTNLEYLLRKRNVNYNTVFDNTSFITKTANINIYHVHGLLPYDKAKEKKYTNSIIFNESEYFYLYNNPYSWNIEKQLHDFNFNCCILIGISLTDPNMKRLLELANNYLKFNFIFMKRQKGYNQKVYRDVTNYFFTYDLITIWIDDFDEINDWLKLI